MMTTTTNNTHITTTTIKTDTTNDNAPLLPPHLHLEKEEVEQEKSTAEEEVERAERRSIKRLRAAFEHKNKERAGVVAALQRKFAPRVQAAAREAYAAAREAAKAGLALQALDAELRKEEALLNGGATAEWPANGIGGVCVAIALRIESRAERIAADAERIAAGAAAFAAAVAVDA
jgi:hypothetical protein